MDEGISVPGQTKSHQDVAFSCGTRQSTKCTDIGFRRISPHHSRAVEVGTDLADRLLHHPDPARPVVVIKGEYDVFELAIKIGGIFVMRREPDFSIANRPSRDAFDMSFGPPAVEHTEVEDAVERGLHATRPRRFEWRQRRI